MIEVSLIEDDDPETCDGCENDAATINIWFSAGNMNICRGCLVVMLKEIKNCMHEANET